MYSPVLSYIIIPRIFYSLQVRVVLLDEFCAHEIL